MTVNERHAQWMRDAAADFEGWDFSYLDGRFVEGEPPWSYLDLARAAVSRASDILDVATGGGEVFASLAPFPERATAVEGHVPNLPVARRRLEPLGVSVFEGNTRSGMPFADESFDLVLSRARMALGPPLAPKLNAPAKSLDGLASPAFGARGHEMGRFMKFGVLTAIVAAAIVGASTPAFSAVVYDNGSPTRGYGGPDLQQLEAADF